jgi:4-amino-4-deoxy-L-arabinose transferase-like glycosyltransferase
MRLAARPWPFALGLAALASLVLLPTVALVLNRDFDGLYGQDSFGYINYAFGPLREALLRLEPLPAWPQPPGFPLVVAATSLITGPDGRIGLAVSLLAGASVPVFTALLAAEAIARGQRFGGRASLALPLLAGLVAALPGQLWQSSAVAMSDTLSIALATAGAWAVCRYARGGVLGWLLGATAALAFAIETRWVYGLVAVPVTIAALIGIGRIWRADRRRALWHILAATLLAAFVLAPVLGPMGTAAWEGRDLPFSADFGAYRWDPGNALRSTFETTDGRLAYPQPSGLFYVLQPVQPYWFGPIGVFAAWGAVWVARRAGVVAATILIGWPAVVVAFLVGAPYQNTRFLLATMPPLAILIAVGLWRLAVAANARLPARPNRSRSALVAAAVTVWVLVAVAVAARFTDGFIDRQSRDLAAIRAIERQVPSQARLIAMGPTGAFVYDGVADVVELFGLTPERALAMLHDARPSYLAIDPLAIDGQWAGRGPALTVEAMRTTLGLTPVAREGGWTLFRIGQAES